MLCVVLKLVARLQLSRRPSGLRSAKTGPRHGSSKGREDLGGAGHLQAFLKETTEIWGGLVPGAEWGFTGASITGTTQTFQVGNLSSVGRATAPPHRELVALPCAALASMHARTRMDVHGPLYSQVLCF